jgi:predicted membrane-bound mannosyltransferase
MPNDLTGLRIIESPLLTKDEQRTVGRPWRERLFTRPWRPWQATKTVTVLVPSDQILRTPDNVLIMHPATADRLRATFVTDHKFPWER